MIIWINGAFGAGKTQTAYELHRRIPHSFVFDPENAGYYIRKNVPKGILKDDFQHYPMWREFNYSMLSYIRKEYDGTIIVPMTVTDPLIFGEIVGRLREDGIAVNHFTLWASKETIRQRLRSRGERAGSWPMQQIDRCVEGLANDVFRHHLETEQLPVPAVAETIASMLNISLQPDHRGKLRRMADRIVTQVRHIRFFG